MRLVAFLGKIAVSVTVLTAGPGASAAPAGTGAPPAAATQRPPQFVLLAFDNCTELERWKDLTEFLDDINKTGDRLRFTFFVSGVNYLATGKRMVYQGPRARPGASNIGWGGTTADVQSRVSYMNSLYKSGNEFGSHAVGHFDGGKWSGQDWAAEFKSYREIVDKMGEFNGLPGLRLLFGLKDFVGFRAPYLSTTAPLYPVLASNAFRYDTSSDAPPQVWPARKDGVWRFNLADLRIHGTGARTLSMDYNFYATQSHAKEDPAHYAENRAQMLNTYLDYFNGNYSGNRAPVHIGHHFFSYQGGVYLQALKAFARLVCGLPEVKCVTYSALADFMDQLSPETLKSLQRGDFPHSTFPRVSADQALASLPPGLAIEPTDDGNLRASLFGAGESRNPASVLVWKLEDTRIGEGPALAIDRLPEGELSTVTVQLQSAEGKELARQTRPMIRRGKSIEWVTPPH